MVDNTTAGEEPFEHPRIRIQYGVHMLDPETKRGLAKCVAEEPADAAIPRLNPGQHTLALFELLVQLVDVCLDTPLVDDPLPGLGVQTQEANGDRPCW